MNAFRRWVGKAGVLIAIAAVTATILVALERPKHAPLDWLLWMTLLTPLYTMGSRPCRRPRWLGGR